MHTENTAWFDIGIREDARPAFLDHGRLPNIINDLPNPEEQYPSLCVFLGGTSMHTTLQGLFPLNNIKRHTSKATIRLRNDVGTRESRFPILFADSEYAKDLPSIPAHLQPGVGQAVHWECNSVEKMFSAVWTRMVFPFTDVVCIYIQGTSDIDRAVDFLASCSGLQTASSLPSAVLPRLIIIHDTTTDKGKAEPMQAHALKAKLEHSGCIEIGKPFSNISFLDLPADTLSCSAKHDRIKTSITRELDTMRTVREKNHFHLNGFHLVALFQCAIQHMIATIKHPFDVIKATRGNRPVSPNARSHLVHYLEAAKRAGVPLRDLVPSISSAIFMNHQVPGMPSKFRIEVAGRHH